MCSEVVVKVLVSCEQEKERVQWERFVKKGMIQAWSERVWE